MEKNNKEQPLLNEFLQRFEKIPTQIVDSLLKVTEDEDEKNVINSFAPTFKNQFQELSRFVSEKTGVATRQGIAEAETFLRVSSGTALADNLGLALPSIGSIVGKLGIAGMVQEIKKIIKKLLELFGIRLPPWIDGIVNLIDEILNHLLGGESTKTRNALSQMEQNYLAELTQLAKLERASQFKFQTEEEEALT